MPNPASSSEFPDSAAAVAPMPLAATSADNRMPLGRKLVLINLALLIALAALGTALAWSVYDMRRAVSGAADEYTELQLIEQAMFHCALAKSQLADPDGGSADAADALKEALHQLQQFRAFQHEEDEASDQHQDDERESVDEAALAITEVLAAIEPMTEGGGVDLKHIHAVDSALYHLSRLASVTDIAGARTATAERTVTALFIVAALSGLVVLASVIASAVCYWAVMNPLRQLHGGVRRIASGTFDERLDERGSREFSELASDFNHMASELSHLYTDLEKKVQTKSRELVRSERLASVGFLAAGVAHEINNPLNIMSGYAEMAQGWLESGRRDGNLSEVQDALEIIRQEAFRCKDITGKLLSLAAGSGSERADVALPRLVNEVVAMVGGLRKYRERTLIVENESGSDQPVHASAAEIKQVLLNLLVNALESLPPDGGEVRVHTLANGSMIEIIVSDTGVGMKREVLDRVFEPFFTARRGAAGTHGTRGVGLGLSITHAIVTGHGGRIRAESDGPGRGSRFIVELPIHQRHSTPTTPEIAHAE